MSNLKVLIVDDEPELRKSIRAVISSKISGKSFEFDEAGDGAEAIEKVKSRHFDIVLMDVRMPKINGLEALKVIKEYNSQIFIVIMTAHSNLQDAVQAIKMGAYDYLAKPVEPEKLQSILNKAIETQAMVTDLAFSQPIFDDDIESEIVGKGEKMAAIYNLINRLSHVDTTVLIRGENGTGKELVANAIHQSSPRKHDNFVTINCAAIPENLIESELFGHERGAFTGAIKRHIGKFQEATNGTLFLDEIGELNFEMQAKLLRVLEEKRFYPVGSNRELRTNARIIVATNRNLEKMIEEKSFRNDLFYRLSVMPIFLPPLRERIEDIEMLCNHFLASFSEKHSRAGMTISPEVIDCFKKYNWPGNIRELRNCIERGMILTKTNEITIDDIPEKLVNYARDNVEISWSQNYVGPLDFDTFKAGAEKEFIVNALRANKGKINKTVAHANIPKNTLLRKIKKYEIEVSSFFD